MDLKQLEEFAAKMGVTIAAHFGGEKGRRYPDGLITLRANLGPVNRLCTLAHELAHHLAGDEPTATGWIHQRQERRAWEQAARWLVSPADYAVAERIHGGHIPGIAHELGVTTHIIEVWQTLYERKTA